MGTREGEARGNVASACVGAWHAGNMLHACWTRAPGVRALGPTGNQPHNTGSAGQADATTPVETRPPFHSHAPLWPCSCSPAARPALSLSARTEQPRMAVMSPLGQWAECREPLGTPPWGRALGLAATYLHFLMHGQWSTTPSRITGLWGSRKCSRKC